MELYNTFLRRLGAAFIDGMLLSAAFAIPGLFSLEAGSVAAHMADLLALAALTVYVVYLTYRYGGTPGKLIVGIKVATVQLEPISIQQSLVRESPIIVFNGIWFSLMLQHNEGDTIAMIVMALACIWWGADALCLLMNEKGRALHDFLAGTVVIRDITLPAP